MATNGTDDPYLVRVNLNCCAADGRPVKVALTGNVPPVLRPDTWLEITGTYTPRRTKDPVNGGPIPYIEVVCAEPVPAPRNPYDEVGNGWDGGRGRTRGDALAGCPAGPRRQGWYGCCWCGRLCAWPPPSDCAWSCSACSWVTFCSAPQKVHCVAYLVETGKSGTKNRVNFVTRFLSVCADGFPHCAHTSVSIAS